MTTEASRGHFSSRIGFIMAAAGSAVGLGNVWGFPTKVAENGGAAFILMYLAMVFVLAFPMLVAELTIGRYGQGNPVTSLRRVWRNNRFAPIVFGALALLAASLILSFYSIVAGWLVAFAAEPLATAVGADGLAAWLTEFSQPRNVIMTLLFSLMTIWVVSKGVADGIEKWSTRLMPILFVLFAGMIIYILMQEGAMDGLRVYLVPDFSHLNGRLIVDAMGQAFFSLSLGVGSMMVYGSYLKKDINLPKVATQVAIIDTSVAFAAGLLIIPAMFVAKHNGVEIFNAAGELISSGDLVFQVLPSMFHTMGSSGPVIAVVFFVLMVIAALTSSISILEVPVACAQDELGMSRQASSWLIGLLIAVASVVICLNFGALFGLVIDISTVYMQPLLGIIWAVVVGWVWHRNELLKELQQGNPEIADGWFWKIWPWYVRFICPVAIVAVMFVSIS
ncbi:sodium-dependent transporter [Bacterioplanoides sp. SCSIO 12839]|uniref:sodium-dependent transporter n=1 Tax=Bacterioplanoides sp. SCSIO 12839 TaxID=2829569 RepID=UPI002106AC87|nr:sodium-dependent transporter [Bacterioplanoides sp. SCSIO 12839]UTW47208.1 sodium-dependent transporter [Bacterioplanoides sp. SCSIO 12839]